MITISGPDGYIYDPDGISGEKIDYMLELRASGNDICEPYAEEFPGATFVAGKKPWEVKCDIALPCGTQNELNGEDADMLLANNPLCVAEVSNMGCTAEAVEKFVNAKMLFAPGKAVNAGGVATSGLEMTQNSLRRPPGGCKRNDGTGRGIIKAYNGDKAPQTAATVCGAFIMG